jgi:WD40 repeat protein
MTRDALVVGINQYPFLKDTSTRTVKHLKTPAGDAEAIAQLLEKYGDFQVQRLPAINQDGKLRVDPNPNLNKLVTIKELQEAITELFHPKGLQVPQTAIFFFAGHGLRRSLDGTTEGYLATSDTNPRKGLWGLSLRWLRQLLQESPVRQQIIWLDCCHSGELLNFLETDLGEYKKGRDRCFIVASRDFQVAYAAVEGDHGVLSGALLQGLDPTRQLDKWVTNYSLVDFVKQALKEAPQHPICTNSGGQIILAGKQSVISSMCPYKGLAYFDFNNEDPKYFCGRAALTKQLVEKVHQSNFLAVLGASGSGKSSVVRAGLLHQLEQGVLPNSDHWKIYKPFTPGKEPLKSLEQVIGVKAENADELARFVERTPAERVVVVVDQFEEVFTECRGSQNKGEERQRFFESLMGAVEQLGNKLCLVLMMRSDFFGKCTEQEYAGLAKKIEQNLVTVLPMLQEELREAIIKPAETVGLEVERELVDQMVDDVAGSPGDLPLLQYTLTELWQHKILNRLVLSEYTRLGGVKKALEKHANQVYQSLKTDDEKLTGKRIFLSLINVGEGTEDTRKQVRQQDLVTPQQSQDLVDQVVKHLADAKLVITAEQEINGERVAVVNIAHEALIRNWNLFGFWLKENREALVIEKPIQAAAEAWRDNKARGESAYLLQGTRLAAAEDYIQRYDNSFPLSLLAQEYVRKSIKHRESSKRNLIITVTAVFLALSGLAGWALIEGEDARIRADSASSESVFASDRKLEALVASIRAGKRLKNPLGAIGAKADTRIQAVTALQQSVYGITELNRFEGHNGSVLDVSISPDGQLIASAGQDGTVKIWNRGGKLINTWSKDNAGNEGKSVWERISSVSFSPDGKIIAFPAGQNIQLIDRSGKSLRTLEYQGEEPSLAGLGINSVSFSPDGQIIAAGGNDQEIRLQTPDGKLLAILTGHNTWISSVVFSPNGQFIGSADSDGTVKLWSREGRLLKTFQHIDIANTPIEKRTVRSVIFSPDSKTIASGGEDGLMKLWKIDGTPLTAFSARRGSIKSVSFSPDGQMIASASSDNTIKIWKSDGTLLTTITGHSSSVNKVRFSPTGQMIVTASDDGTIRLWTLSTTSVSTLKGHISSVTDVEFSPDGQIIATSSQDRTIKLWSQDGRLNNTLIGHDNTVKSLSFSPDGQLIASSEEFGKNFKLWKRDGTLLNTVGSSEVGTKEEVRFSPADRLIASAGRLALELWNYQGKLVSTIEKDDRTFYSVTFSSDGQIIASYRVPNTRMYDEGAALKLWQINGKFITNLIGNRASFSPDGKVIATASEDGVVRLFKRDGSLISNLTGHSKKVTDVSFSPDSQMIASASEDGTVKLWSRNGTLIKTLDHSGSVNSLSFRPDGRILATAVDDGTVLLWNLDLDDLLARGCTWAHGYLENNRNVAKADRSLCNGVSSPKAIKKKVN